MGLSSWIKSHGSTFNNTPSLGGAMLTTSVSNQKELGG